MIFVILTYHGTVLGIDSKSKKFVHKSIESTVSNKEFEIATFSRVISGGDFECLDLNALIPTTSDTTKQQLPFRFYIVPTLRGRCVYLRHSRVYACAMADGTFECNRQEASQWETFLLCEQEHFYELQTLYKLHWINIDRSYCVAPRTSIISPNFLLNFDKYTIDISINHPFLTFQNLSSRFCNITNTPKLGNSNSFVFVLIDGVKVLATYNSFYPIVYYVVMGSDDTFKQFEWSLRSLRNVAGYQGHVHIITNDPSKIIISSENLDQTTIQLISAYTYSDYTSARYQIVDYEKAWSARPLLYIDNDVAFNLPIDGLLTKIAANEGVHADPEEFSLWSEANSVGAQLFQNENQSIDPSLFGFNSGILGLSSLKDAFILFKSVYEFALRENNKLPAPIGPPGDQPILNYLSSKISHVKTEVMCNFVTVGYHDELSKNGDKKGMIHFWPFLGQAAKAIVMEHYVSNLLQDVRL